MCLHDRPVCMYPSLLWARQTVLAAAADNQEGPMQHMSPRTRANGFANGTSPNGYDAEAAKVAATAAKQVVQGLKATAAAFTAGSKATVTTPSSKPIASVGDC